MGRFRPEVYVSERALEQVDIDGQVVLFDSTTERYAVLPAADTDAKAAHWMSRAGFAAAFTGLAALAGAGRAIAQSAYGALPT